MPLREIRVYSGASRFPLARGDAEVSVILCAPASELQDERISDTTWERFWIAVAVLGTVPLFGTVRRPRPDEHAAALPA